MYNITLYVDLFPFFENIGKVFVVFVFQVPL